MTGLIGRSVAVIGGGVAGLATATALAQRGADVTVHEKASQIAEVGAGLQISPNGSGVLAALGLAEELLQAGLVSQAVHLRDYKAGRNVLTLDLSTSTSAHPFVLIHRAGLIDLLLGAAQRAGVQVELGSAADPQIDAVLIVGADGSRSTIRGDLCREDEPVFSGQVAWRALIAGDGRPEAQVWMGPGRHLVTYPLAGKIRNIVAVEEREDWTAEGWDHSDQPENLRQAFAAFAPEVRDWLADVSEVKLWGLFRRPVAPVWQDGRIVLVGDAAHPTLPFLAQGANLALEDAWVLASCLDLMPQTLALKAYQERRLGRAARVVAAANANARNYHLRHPLVRAAAHTALRAGGRLAPSAALRKFQWLYGHDVTAG